MQKLASVRQSAATSTGRKALRDVSLRVSAAKRVAAQSFAAGTRSRHRSRSARKRSGISPEAKRRSTDDGMP